MDLVDDLLRAGLHRHHAAGFGDLGDDEGAVLRNLHDREAEVSHAGDVLLARLGEVAARDLTAAFEQMTDHGALAQLVPVVQPPAKLVDERRHENRRVGDAAGDDHIRTLVERLQNALDTHVGVGGDDSSGQLTQRLAGLPDLNVHILFDVRQQIVAGDAGDLHAGQTVLFRDFDALGGTRLRVGGAHVGDELDMVLPAERQRLFHAVLQQTVIALRGVLELGLLTDGDRALCEALVADIIEVSLFAQLQRGLQTVARVARAGPDADGFHSRHLPFCRFF